MRINWRYWRRVWRTAQRVAGTIDSPAYSEFSGVFPLHYPRLDIELDATPDQLSSMLLAIERSWSKMGEDWPHFSVLSEEQYLPGNLAGSLDQFWAIGRGEADLAVSLLRQLDFGDPAEKTCVEYGCGVGRVTIPLAARFGEVHAYDISASHLALARQRAETMRAANIGFHHRGSGLLEPLAPCDFFYSRLVFQHNPPPVMRELVRLALASLRPGGVAIFEIPVYLAGYRFHIDDYLDNPPPERMQMHCLPQREIFSLISQAGCFLLEVREDRTIEIRRECLGNFFVIGRPAA
ncbi:MAG TPA: class I SAM-dependent methyltransferase [Stellaceae bacterium]|nr:class I SAM-dependent methyltransferase [Stellaceae bacterium]